MNPRGTKMEPKLGLDMSFGELVQRLVQTDPKEVERSMAKSKKKKPPGSGKPSGGKRKSRKVARP